MAKEWNNEKNGDTKPSDVLPGSHKKVWWRCENNHEWEAIIRDRIIGKNCPYCSNTKVLSGFNDLATVHPEIAREWNYEKNGNLVPVQVKYSANIKVWWRCAQGHEWQAYVFNRSKGHGCPFCCNFSAMAGYNDLATTNPKLASEWDYSKNGDLLPTNVTAGSKKRVWWKCSNGHEWKAEIKSRNAGNNCPYCSNKKVLSGFNDLFTYCKANQREDLINEFDNEKNEFSMKDILTFSKKNIWWRCSNGHSFQCDSYRRIKNGTGCGICSHNLLLKNDNDLLTTHPEIAKEWDYSKNTEKPDEVMAGSNIKKYWFICPKGHSYKATPLQRKKGGNCPVCAMERHMSFPEKAIYFYIKKAFTDAQENYRSSFLGRMEIDIYVPKLALGIEYDGVAWHRDQMRDKKKDDLCSKHGITLVRIRETGCNDYESNSIKKYVSPYDMQALNEAVLFLFNYLNQKFHIDLKADVDIDRDRMSILGQINHSEKNNSVANYCPEILKFWDCEKNGKITPEQIPHASMKKFSFKCEAGHEWEAVISNFTSSPWCPYCSGRKVLPGFNDLFTTNPELRPYWSKNNTTDPAKIKSGCNLKALWYCPQCGGEYSMKVVEKVKTPGCPYCSGHRVLKGFNDLASLVPQVTLDWDYDKNELTPDEVTKGSSKRVWWKCHVCNYEWETAVYYRGVLNRECPACKKAKSVNPNSKPVIQYSLDGAIICEYNCVIDASRKTGIKSIYKACRKEVETAGGFVWKYKDKQL